MMICQDVTKYYVDIFETNDDLLEQGKVVQDQDQQKARPGHTISSTESRARATNTNAMPPTSFIGRTRERAITQNRDCDFIPYYIIYLQRSSTTQPRNEDGYYIFFV